nr:hypothetical protein [Tanacetum cinerariifolium]
MIVFLTKFDASEGFDQIVDFMTAHIIQYTLMVNLTIYVSCIKQFWASVSIKKSNDAMKLQALIDRKKLIITEDTIRQALRLDNADGLKRGKITKLDADEDVTLVDVDANTQGRMEEDVTAVKDINATQSEPTVFDDEEDATEVEEDEGDNEVSAASTPPSPKSATTPLSPQQEPIRSPPQAQPAQPSSPPHHQPAQPAASSESLITLLNTLMETCATLTQKVANLEQDKVAQEVEIVKLKQRVRTLENKRKTKHSGLKRGKIAELDADGDVTLLDVDADTQGRMEEDMVKRIEDEEIEQVAARERQEKEDLERAKVQPIFEREYKHVQTFLKSDKDEEPTKKRPAKETLLQESFKKLRAEVEVLDMLKDFDRDDLDALWRITKEKFSTAMLTHVKEKALWAELTRLYEPNTDDVFWKIQRYMYYPIIWKLHLNCGVHQVSSTTRRYDIYMLAEKDYPLSDEVMTLMLSSRLQVEEDSETARDLVMKIFLKAN